MAKQGKALSLESFCIKKAEIMAKRAQMTSPHCCTSNFAWVKRDNGWFNFSTTTTATVEILLNPTIIYLAKCMSYPSHFLATTCSALSPGLPYVTGAKKRNPQNVIAKMKEAAIQLPIWLVVVTRSRTGRDRVLRWPRTAGDSGSKGSMQKMNSTRAPVTKHEARWAGR